MMINITIKTFATVKDICNFNEKKITIPEGSSINDVINGLSREHKSFNEIIGTLLFAVNESYCPLDTLLKHNDILAIFPPVSGG